MKKTYLISLIKLLVSMTVFGTIGLFVRYIPLPSSVIALARGIIGSAFLMLLMVFRRHKINKASIRYNLVLLILSGACIGFNWIFLFEAYRFTSIAVSTLCYYMAPVFVILFSPIFLKESLNFKKIVCVLVALIGMVFISGVFDLDGINPGKIKRIILGLDSINLNEIKGIIFGLLAASLYATVMVLNKKMIQIDAYDKTVFQLIISALTLIPYCLFTVNTADMTIHTTGVLALVFVGVIHTGLTYFLYFGSMDNLNGQTVAVLSYLDPIIAVLISTFILREKMGWYIYPGTILILGSAILLEIPLKRRSR